MKASGFARLDAAMGGFVDGKTYLVYGPPRSGKTEFCLSFLGQGLQGGETAALVTSQKPEEVIECAVTYGLDLSQYLRSKKLRIFEYPEDIQQATAGASDLSQIVAEFRHLLGSEPASRLVFDPISPLLPSNEDSTLHRCRSVLQPIAGLNAATLLVVEAVKTDKVLSYCKDLVSSVLRFAPASKPGGPRYLRVESHQEKPETVGLYRFELEAGVGFIEAEEPVITAPKPAPAPVLKQVQPQRSPQVRPQPEAVREPWHASPPSSPSPSPRPQAPPVTTVYPAGDSVARVLIVDPDPGHRSILRLELQRSFTVLEACGSMDAMTLLSAKSPAAIVLALELEGESGVEVACKFRQTGWNVPIIGVSRERLTITDHVSALASGVDVCLRHPTDGRILRLTVFNALCRRGTSRRQEQALVTEPVTRRADHTTSTADLSTLHARLVREIAYSREQATPFVIATMRVNADIRQMEQLASLAFSLLRPSDLIYVGERGVACLLADSQSADPFLSTFWNYWKGDVTPQFNQLRFDGQPSFLDAAREMVVGEVGESNKGGGWTVVGKASEEVEAGWNEEPAEISIGREAR